MFTVCVRAKLPEPARGADRTINPVNTVTTHTHTLSLYSHEGLGFSKWTVLAIRDEAWDDYRSLVFGPKW